MSSFNSYSNIGLPINPGLSATNPAFQDIFNLYTAVQLLAQQIDTVLTLSEDIRVDDSSRGLILKDTQATPNYWRITVNTVGALVVTNIGTALPT